jgi:hypothetical protein
MKVQNSLISLFDVNGNCEMMQAFLTYAKKKRKKKEKSHENQGYKRLIE